MGLINKIVCGIMMLGAFQLGRYTVNTRVEKQDVFEYIDKNKSDRKEIYAYTRKYLRESDSLYLDSLITEEQRKKIATDYLKNPGNFFEIVSDGISRDVRTLGDKAKRAYRELEKQIYRLKDISIDEAYNRIKEREFEIDTSLLNTYNQENIRNPGKSKIERDWLENLNFKSVRFDEKAKISKSFLEDLLS